MECSDLTASYLAELGLEGDDPTPSLLAEILRAHIAMFAFSSVGPRLGDELPLEPESLYERIVVRRRGGYCFEQNGLLFEVLSDLGFRPRRILGRVLISGNPDPGLTHRIAIVEIDGRPHLVDGGFGAPGPHLPVPLDGEEVGSSWRRFRVVELGPRQLHLQSVVDGDWRSLYRFELLDYGETDCEIGHFYSYRHPRASFVNSLVVSRILDDEVRSLRDRDYWVLRPDGAERRTIDDAELQDLLADELDVHVTPDEAARLLPRTPGPDGSHSPNRQLPAHFRAVR